jgi:hypothetical protein
LTRAFEICFGKSVTRLLANATQAQTQRTVLGYLDSSSLIESVPFGFVPYVVAGAFTARARITIPDEILVDNAQADKWTSLQNQTSLEQEFVSGDLCEGNERHRAVVAYVCQPELGWPSTSLVLSSSRCQTHLTIRTDIFCALAVLPYLLSK